jgi:hypothetical protein
MKKHILALPAMLVFLMFGLGQVAWAQTEPGYYDSYSEAGAPLLSPEELDDLVAPIALYPDPLIAQILPAATYVDQIDEAARFVRQYGSGTSRIDEQPWDVSVKAIAHYPNVLFMMDQRYEWTVALGQAFIEQPQDVMDSIQELRAEARAQGNLFSTAQQQVIYEDGLIRIVPARPEYIYIPVYDPQVVYVEPYTPSYPLISFGVGFAIGAWLSRDCDWRHHRVYYHGWRGGGWISRARPHVHDRRGVYINNRATVININQRVMTHDTSRFRQELRTETARRRESRPAPAGRINRPRPRGVQQPRPGVVQQPRAGRVEPSRPGRVEQPRPERTESARPGAVEHPRPGAVEKPRQPRLDQQRAPGKVEPTVPAAAPTVQPPGANRERPQAERRNNRDLFRGRDVQKTQPASQSGYGGYGSSKDATIYRQRGQSSRENMRQTPSPAPVVAPTPRPVPHVPRPIATPERPPVAVPAPRAVAPAPRPAVAPPAHMERPAPAPRPAAPPAPRPSPPGRERER